MELDNIKNKPIEYIDSQLLTENKILELTTKLYANLLKYFDFFSQYSGIKENFDSNYKINNFPNEQIKIKIDQLAISILTNIHEKNRKTQLTEYYKKFLILYVVTFVQNAYKLFVMEVNVNEAMIPLKKTSFHLLALTNYEYVEKNLINYIQLPIHQNEVNKITQLFELFKNKCENLKTEKDLRVVIEIHYHLESLKLGDKTFNECKEISQKLLKKFDNYCDSWEIIVFDIILFCNSAQMSQDLFLERLNYSYSFHMNFDFNS